MKKKILIIHVTKIICFCFRFSVWIKLNGPSLILYVKNWWMCMIEGMNVLHVWYLFLIRCIKLRIVRTPRCLNIYILCVIESRGPGPMCNMNKVTTSIICVRRFSTWSHDVGFVNISRKMSVVMKTVRDVVTQLYMYVHVVLFPSTFFLW